MKKTSLLATLALAGGIMSCATPYTANGGGEKEKYVPHPETILNSDGQNNDIIGRQISKLLKDEFDHVGYYDFKGDLVIRGEKKIDGKYYSVWGLNLNCLCQAYTMGRPVLDVLLGRQVIADECNGGVNSTQSMSKHTAINFTEILDLYVSNNTARCQDWVEFMKKNYGPFAPKDQKDWL